MLHDTSYDRPGPSASYYRPGDIFPVPYITDQAIHIINASYARPGDLYDQCLVWLIKFLGNQYSNWEQLTQNI